MTRTPLAGPWFACTVVLAACSAGGDAPREPAARAEPQVVREVDPRIDERVLAHLSVESSVAARRSAGGTAPERVTEAIAAARASGP
jgi:argininosuccinate lyase